MRSILSLFYKTLPILAMFIVSCQTSSKTSTAKLLKFNLEKNKGYSYDMNWDLTSTVMGQSSNVLVNANYSMTVADDNGQVKTIEMMYDRMKMKMTLMGMNLEADSEKPVVEEDTASMEEENPLKMMNKAMSMMNKTMAALTNKPFTMKVDVEGNIVEVNGFDKILSDMLDSMDVDPGARQNALASIKDQFGENQLKDQFAQIFTMFPNKEIKVGDTWERSYTQGGKMKAKFNTKYTVKEIEGDHVTLESRTKIEPADKDFELSGEQTGNYIVDSKTGLVINAEFDQDMTGKVEGQTISIKGKGGIKGTAK